MVFIKTPMQKAGRIFLPALVLLLEFCGTGGSREGENVADILDSGKIHDDSFKTKTVTGVFAAAVTAKVKIPAVIFFFKSKFVDAVDKNVKTLFSLASANDFANAGNKMVCSGNGFSVVVLAHIECFDLFRIVGYKDRSFINFLGKITFVLGLKIASPIYGIIKTVFNFGKNFDCFGVIKANKFLLADCFKTFDKAFVIKIVEEFHFSRAVIKNIAEDIFDHIFGKLHFVFKVCKSNFRFDHPEFGGVALGIGFFRAEGGSEGIDVAESHCHCFAFKLARNGKTGCFSEEILAEINGAVFVSRRIGRIKGCYSEHFACAFTAGTSDERSMNIDKSSALEELVNCKSGGASYSECRGEGVCSRAEMSDGAEIFKAVALFLKRIIRGGFAFNNNFGCVDFKRLFCFGGKDYAADYGNSGADVEFVDLLEIIDFIFLINNLDIGKTGSVVKFNKAYGFGVAGSAKPAADLARLFGKTFRICKNKPQLRSFHGDLLMLFNNITL